ncbi:MAG: hypothetical protein GW949_06100 [Spirochaetales bacterium]|nr:hypothetical protein [Spirochaetales bacterium]
MKTKIFSGFIGLLLAGLGGCIPFSPLVVENPPPFPPLLLNWKMESESRGVLEFSVPVNPGDPELWGTDESHAIEVSLPSEGYDTHIRIDFVGELPLPGDSITLVGRVEDRGGSGLSFTAPLYGMNAHLPVLHINEVRAVNTTTKAEAVELRAEEPGDLGGITLIFGNPVEPGSILRLPRVEVSEGDMIVVHFRADPAQLQGDYGNWGLAVPTGSAEIPGVMNLYLPGGLSATAELILLARDPRGVEFLDGIFYSNKSNNPEDRYRGFGTLATLKKAEFFGTTNLWYPETPEAVNPEDFPTSLGLTSTRTLNRRPYDPNLEYPGKADWFIGATSTGSIGAENTTVVYEP